MRFLVFSFILLACLASLSCSAQASQKNTSLVIPLNEWSSQRVLSRAIGKLIEQQGVPVSYQEINVEDQWGALQRGIVHIQLEVWQPSMAKPFQQYVSKNKILDLGRHQARVREDWWYPEYVENLCPDLPSWRALNACAPLFSRHFSKGKGVYYAGPWDYGDAELIRQLGLNFVIKRDKSDAYIWHRLKQAMIHEEPIIHLNWTPNWTDVRIKGKFIEFPHARIECASSDGEMEKQQNEDCFKSRRGWLKKAAWPGIVEHWPCIYQVIKKISLTREMIAEAGALVAADGYNEHKAADLWLEKYQAQAQDWFDVQCR